MAEGLGGAECVEGRLDECRAYWVVCRSGLPEVLGERMGVFRMLKAGAVSTAVSDDMETVYYVYVDEGGGGFYVEAAMDAPDRPECAGPLLEAILGHGYRLLSHLPGWPAVQLIVSRMMFPGAGAPA